LHPVHNHHSALENSFHPSVSIVRLCKRDKGKYFEDFDDWLPYLSLIMLVKSMIAVVVLNLVNVL